MSVMDGISAILSGGWQLLSKTAIPGLGFSYAMLLVGLALVPVGFRFLSIALGFSVGHLTPRAGYGSRGSKDYKTSEARKNDVR